MNGPVVHLVTRLNVGGIARFLEAGRDAVDLLLRGRVEPGEHEAPWNGQQMVLPRLHRSLAPADELGSFLVLRKTLRRLKPALLHTHASKAGALGRAAARSLKIPCVHTFHGHVLEGYFPRPVSWILGRVERGLGRRSLVTATGPATARDLERRLGLPVAVIPPGARLPPCNPGARRRWRATFGEPRRVALCVGRADAVKGLDRFVQAARATGYLPVIAGAESVEGALCLGRVEAMADLYAACDVVVSASFREGTPYALLEAAWCCRPVVAPPVGDVEWVVGEGGLVTDDLEGALVRLHDPALRRRLGLRAARRVRRRFPADGVAPRLRELYARAVAG